MATIDTIITDAHEFATSLQEEARVMAEEARTVSQGRIWTGYFPIGYKPLDDADDFDLQIISSSKPAPISDQYAPPVIDTSASAPNLEIPVPFPPPEMPTPPPPLDISQLFQTPPPVWSIAAFTASAPSLNLDVLYPEPVAIDNILAPSPGDSGITVPEIVVPTFDESFNGKEFDVVETREIFETSRENNWPAILNTAESYVDTWFAKNAPEQSAQFARLEERIASGVSASGSVGESWEGAAYDRAMLNTIEERLKVEGTIADEYGRRGFVAPPGAMMSALLRVQQDGANNMARVSAEIAAERVRIELQHLQFCMGLSATLRQGLISAAANHMQLLLTANGQAIEYAREVARAAAEVFNQRRDLYQLELQRFQLESQVYTVKLESAFAIIRKFQAEIDAEKLNIDLDRNAIALYEAKISGQRQKIELYNAQLMAVRTQLETEAQKIAIFESQVRSYVAQVGAKESEFNAYRSVTESDRAYVEAYRAQVGAFSEQVQAVGVEANVQQTIAQIVQAHNQALLQRQEAAIKKYAADIQGESTRISANVDTYRAAVQAYAAEVDAQTRMLAVRYDKERVRLSALVAEAENRIKVNALNVEAFTKSISAQGDITNSSASILGNMAASALSVSNAIISKAE